MFTQKESEYQMSRSINKINLHLNTLQWNFQNIKEKRKIVKVTSGITYSNKNTSTNKKGQVGWEQTSEKQQWMMRGNSSKPRVL